MVSNCLVCCRFTGRDLKGCIQRNHETLLTTADNDPVREPDLSNMRMSQITARHEAPVFVVGCPRSGTTLLYDMLLSSGGFAVYPAESNVFNVLQPRFGDLGQLRNRQQLLNVWLRSKLFRASGLDAVEVHKEVLNRCSNAGDFLEIIMGQIARAQGVHRWADNSPEELLYLRAIKKQLPNALIIHVIRDGRDVALSLWKKERFLRPFPWRKRETIVGAGLYWEWMVQRGRKQGSLFAPDYTEVHFEDLVLSPRETLVRLGKFLDHDLDLDRIRRNALGAVKNPNTSFRKEFFSTAFTPVGRWKNCIGPRELLQLEVCIGSMLRECGYEIGDDQRNTWLSHEQSLVKRTLYRAFFRCKFWYKNSSLVRTFRPLVSAETLDEMVIAEDWAGQTIPGDSVPGRRCL